MVFLRPDCVGFGQKPRRVASRGPAFQGRLIIIGVQSYIFLALHVHFPAIFSRDRCIFLSSGAGKGPLDPFLSRGGPFSSY